MENITEENQTDLQMDAEILNQTNDQNEKKGCKTCGGGNDSKKFTFHLIALGVFILFTSFYGVIKIVQDVIGLFTR